MLTKLSLQNILRKKSRNLLAMLSISIGTAAMILFLGISSGIQSATFDELEKQNPLTQITVRPNTDNTGLVAFFTDRENRNLTKEDIEKISEIEGIVNIHPETQFNSFASIEASLLGFVLVSDTMIFGLPQEFIASDLSNPEIWTGDQKTIPTIIPRKILDIYNFAIASPQGLPLLSEENLIGKKITLFPNHSNFFPAMNQKNEEIDLEVVGFSDRVNLVGITIPDQLVQELNQKYTNTQNDPTYIELFIETENSGITTEVATEIETLGYSTQYFQKDIQSVESKFSYLTASLGIISGIILLTSSIAIISTFLATVAERTSELGLFRALGATKKQIKFLILTEASIVGMAGSLFGIIIGIITSKIIDIFGLQQLSTATFTPESLFKISPQLMLSTLLFGTLLAIITAYLPAKKASNIDPIEALNK